MKLIPNLPGRAPSLTTVAPARQRPQNTLIEQAYQHSRVKSKFILENANVRPTNTLVMIQKPLK